MEKIKELFKKIKKAHLIYVRCNEEQKEELSVKMITIFDQLEVFGVARHFSESLFFFGEEFLATEYGTEEERIFGRFMRVSKS